MKKFSKISQNQLIGLLTLIFVVVVGVLLYFGQTPTVVEEEAEFDPNETPPLVQIDAGYNATLSGEPFYVVEDNDEDFDDSLDVCNEFGSDRFRRDVQNGWYQVVAYEENLTVEEVIFQQIDLREGDKMVAVLYDADDQEWKAWPNRIIVDENGNNVDLLDRDEDLDKGTVVSVSVDRDTDYCADYDEVGDHENIELKWNLVSRPDFDDVDYRTIWEVAFAKGGNSGVDLERYYSASDPSNSTPPNQLTTDQLYWVYGGEASTVTGGGTLPDEPLTDEPDPLPQLIVVKVDNENGSGQRDVVNDETFQIDEDGGLVEYSVGLAVAADGEVELEFEIYEDGQLVAVESAVEIASRKSAGDNDFRDGVEFADGENDLVEFVLEAINDDLAEIPKTVEVRIVDKAGELDTVKFKIEIVDDELSAPQCTGPLRYGVSIEVRGLAGNLIEDARVVAIDSNDTIVSESNGILGGGRDSVYLNGRHFLLPGLDGSYTIRVEKTGVASEDVDVNISKDDCGPINQEVVVTLTDRVEQNVDLAVTVRDAVTGDLLQGANVVVEGTTLGGVTDFDGLANVVGVPEFGRLEVSLAGYRTGNFRIADNFEGALSVQIAPQGQETFGPGLELLGSQVATNEVIQAQVASGYEIDDFCGADDTCTLTLGGETFSYSSIDGLYSTISFDGIISLFLRDNSTDVDFEVGEYTLLIDGARYRNGQLVPKFERTITVVQ